MPFCLFFTNLHVHLKKGFIMEYIINHLPERHLFTTEIEGYTAYVEYRLQDESLDILHTIVPPPLEGRGIAAALVKKAYEYASEQGLKPKATCSYAVKWLERHPIGS